jgi:O-antigen ligase
VAAAAVAAAVVVGAVYLVAVGSGGTEVSSGGAGRTSLIRGGLDLARDRPIWGWGSGSFGEAFYTKIEKAKTTTSHDTPIAVAAEQGVIGLAALVALVVSALFVLFGGGVRGSPARATLAALFVAMLVHSLGYASFLEDPATWAILAVGAALAGARPAPAPAPG